MSVLATPNYSGDQLAADGVASLPLHLRLEHYVREIWKCRYFWMALVKMDLRTRYRRSVLGIGWSLLQPICFTIVICAVFHQMFKADIREFAPYLMCGLSFWNFLTHVTLQGAQSFYTGEPYIRQHPAPMAIYPLRTVLGGSFHFLLSLGAALVLTLIMKGSVNPLALAAFVPTLALLVVFGWSLSVLSGVLAVFFPDTRHLTEVALQFLFYITPIMYPRDVLAGSSFSWILSLNPFAVMVSVVRDPIVFGNLPSTSQTLTMIAITGVCFLVAAVTLAKLEKKIVFYL